MSDSKGGRAAPLFIMGCQRSGTTLLALVLNSHPEIEVIDEDDSRFHFISGPTYLLDFVQALRISPSAPRFRIFKAPRDSHRAKELLSLSAGARILWTMRPVEQVVASMCSLRIAAASWAVSHAPREIQKYVDTFPGDLSVAAAFTEYAAIRAARQREILLATLCWVAKEKCRVHARSGNPGALYCSNYVDLVKDPAATTRQLCHFIGAAWVPSLLHHHTIHSGWRIGKTLAQRAIDTSSTDKWRQVLSADELRVMHSALVQLEAQELVAESAAG